MSSGTDNEGGRARGTRVHSRSSMSSQSESVSVVSLWRTNFLTLRDESLTPTEEPSPLPIIRDLILSHRHSLVAAAAHLSQYEVSSDLTYLLCLAASCADSNCEGNDGEENADVLTSVCHLVHDVACSVVLRLSSPAWSQLLDSFSNLVGFFLNSRRNIFVLGTATTVEAVLSCLDITRCFIGTNDHRLSLSDNVQLLNFLLYVVNCCHAQLHKSFHHEFNGGSSEEGVHNIHKSSSLWKTQAVAFSMIGEAFSREGSLLPVESWHFTLKVLRKVMDSLAKKTVLLEDTVMPRYYVSLLNCLQIVLANRKGSLSDQVAAIVATLRMFLTYGLSNTSQVSSRKNIGSSVSSNCLSVTESDKTNSGRYKPPHLRKTLLQSEPNTFKTFQDHALSPVDSMSSDSEYSDSERQDDVQYVWVCKARLAAIKCIQDLCSLDSKAFVAQWMMLLPTNDVLHPRKHEMTLMTCLLYDPYIKARLAAASAIAAMLDGPSSVVLQVAEYKDSFRCGSYMSLSSSLGQILMQLHVGILHLVQHETHIGLLMSSFKILNLLIALTPYSRMPRELILSILSSLKRRILEGFPYKSDQNTLLALSVSCLTATLSTSPSSTDVIRLLQDEISTGLIMRRPGDGILSTLFQLANQAQNPKLSFEALQALRAVYHNYPHLMLSTREQVLGMVKGFLESDPIKTHVDKGPVGGNKGSSPEKVVAAAVKVLDEFLRAATGFRGTEDAFEDKLVQTPFNSDCVRSKKISSAPSYVRDASEDSESCSSGLIEWQKALEELLPFTLCYSSGLVRSASITCFAGLTSPVFCCLKQEAKDFILSTCTVAATKDGVTSVRAAACRAIGVMTCFPDICRSAEILQKFVEAAEMNTYHQLISVRIPATWAIANICDSLHHCFVSMQDVRFQYQILASLSECALRLAKDGDKIKSNAVRALGSLSRYIHFEVKSGELLTKDFLKDRPFGLPNCCMDMNLLDRIVQTFLSCITTGNVKVQWNVCYALSKLFLNEKLDLQHMDWAPSVYNVLLVLLRDSSNFKIRIQAAAALAMPCRLLDYGRSFPDVVQGVEHVIESLESCQSTLPPPSLKYRIALENQVTSTFLHIISLCSTCGDEGLKKFLQKKIPFLEGWFQSLCASLEEGGNDKDDMGASFNIHQKTDLIIQAARSLIQVYEGQGQTAPAERLKKVLNDCPLVVAREGRSVARGHE